jgi:hypothetical protein
MFNRHGHLHAWIPGAVITVKDLITMMIIVSDNTAGRGAATDGWRTRRVTRACTRSGVRRPAAIIVPSTWFQGLQAAGIRPTLLREGQIPLSGYRPPGEWAGSSN